MAIETASGTARDKEDKSYVKSLTRPNQTAQEVVVGNSAVDPVNAVLVDKFQPPKDADSITVEYPDTLTEVYKFRQGGLTGTVLSQVTVVYRSCKKKIVSVVVE